MRSKKLENQKLHPNTCQQGEIRRQNSDPGAGGLSFELGSWAQGQLHRGVTCAVEVMGQRQNLDVFGNGAKELLTD